MNQAFWQPIRGIFRSPRVVFLDRLCIPQDDEDQNGGFLQWVYDGLRILSVLWARQGVLSRDSDKLLGFGARDVCMHIRTHVGHVNYVFNVLIARNVCQASM